MRTSRVRVRVMTPQRALDRAAKAQAVFWDALHDLAPQYFIPSNTIVLVHYPGSRTSSRYTTKHDNVFTQESTIEPDANNHYQYLFHRGDWTMVVEPKYVRVTGGIPDSIAPLLHQCLKILAGDCDGAQSLDGVGFSKVDTVRGRKLARQVRLCRVEYRESLELVRRYRRQLPERVLEEIRRGLESS